MTRTIRLAALASVLASAPCPASAGDGPGVDFGPKTLAPWEQAGKKDLGDLSEAARSIRASVVLVGSPKTGTGTAFVISKKHRLLATNAHVADLMPRGGELLAIVQGVPATYKVDRVWYHPGVLREVDRAGANTRLLRSTDPALGPVHPFCPDVAVLRLTGDGPDLPAEVELADWDEVKDLFARPIGIVGFPGYNTKGWPEAGHRVASTFQSGMISRATNFKLDADADPEDLQYLQHSAPGWFGFSGSPIFLANGHVVALHNSARTAQAQGLSTSHSQGVRIDCLRELLVHHKLDELVPRRPDGLAIQLDRSTKPDPARDDLMTAMLLSQEARALIDQGKPGEAMNRADRAVKLAPEYGTALRRRAEARWALCSDPRATTSREEKLAILKLAIADMEAAMKRSPSPSALVDYIGLKNFTFALSQAPANSYRENIVLLDRLLQVAGLPDEEKGRAHQARAAARWALGDDDAIRDFDRAAELSPSDPDILEDRAVFLSKHGKPELAKKDIEHARSLRQAKPDPQDR